MKTMQDVAMLSVCRIPGPGPATNQSWLRSDGLVASLTTSRYCLEAKTTTCRSTERAACASCSSFVVLVIVSLA